MNHDDWYEQVHKQQDPVYESSGWIQWKGTDVCIDLHCKCGATAHVDADFFYHYRCRKCGREYALSPVVKLIELNAEQGNFIELGGGCPFITGDSE